MHRIERVEKMGRIRLGNGLERLEDRNLFEGSGLGVLSQAAQQEVNGTIPGSTPEGEATPKFDVPFWNSWMCQYGDRNQRNIGPDATAELIILAQRRMFLQAELHVRDVGGSLYSRVTADPQTAFWSNSGYAVEF